MLEAHIDLLTDDAGVAGDRGADQIRAQLQRGFFIESGRQSLLRKLNAVTLNARELDFERIAIRSHRFDLNRLARWLRRSNDGLGCKVEWDTKHVGVFDVE